MNDKSPNIIQTIGAYGKGLFNFIRGRVTTKEEAEDILQDVWYQLSHVTDLDEVEQMSSWLFRVARNKIIDRSRKKTVESLENFTYADEDGEYSIADILLIDDADPETEYLKDLFWQELFTALDELPKNQKQVFIWNELEDKTLQQIADMTGENLKTIISRKGYAVKHLRKRLENLYNEFLDL
ncbi:RNA polymerase subunit sigma-24 [Adhaeribacter arboris]|uniref:RNA polymerase subunit sigma-24 n=1 Tax=Adhaeribacter arboris TaxID=2072846 RepID=A0A2T2YBR1_9BACT|nr:sigma-70 family RNA polymerase sigma factor [Adhaeribacter arboris]PSR52970.1 RNA polymerase subunit sigma-24 [Adhaeribacter arboris]